MFDLSALGILIEIGTAKIKWSAARCVRKNHPSVLSSSAVIQLFQPRCRDKRLGGSRSVGEVRRALTAPSRRAALAAGQTPSTPKPPSAAGGGRGWGCRNSFCPVLTPARVVCCSLLTWAGSSVEGPVSGGGGRLLAAPPRPAGPGRAEPSRAGPPCPQPVAGPRRGVMRNMERAFCLLKSASRHQSAPRQWSSRGRLPYLNERHISWGSAGRDLAEENRL